MLSLINTEEGSVYFLYAALAGAFFVERTENHITVTLPKHFVRLLRVLRALSHYRYTSE